VFPFSSGLSETKVESAEEVLALMRQAQDQRQTGETNMNKQSSRSHCIFTLKVQAKRKIGDGSVLEVSGKLHCVDLAGSECAKSADMEKGCDDHQASRERERMNINRSLLTLGRVVSMLKEQSQGKKGKNSVRIPYRDSKLTRILQESLGGRCKTCLIATVSPSITAIEESMSTLNYAQAANGIINKPVISSLMTGAASSMAIDKKATSGGESGTVEHWHEMECRLQYMQSQVEEAQQALARKHLQQQELIEKTECAENARATAIAQLEESQRENKVLEKEIEEHVAVNNQLSERLEQTEQTLRETTAILKTTQETETRLTKEAQDLISLLRKSTEDGDAMHQALLQNRGHEVARRGATKAFQESMLGLLTETAGCLDTIGSTQKEQNAVLRDSSVKHFNAQNATINNQQQLVDEIKKTIKAAVVSLKDQMTGDSGITETYNETASNICLSTDALRTLGSDYLQETKSVCEGLRERLISSAGTLNKMERTYANSSANMLETLTEEVVKSKENLSQMVLSITEALAHAKEERNKSRDALCQMVRDWKASSLEATKTIGQASKTQGTHVQSLLEMLASEAKRHDEVSRELSEQREFLQEQSKLHLGKLGEQSNLLASQKESFQSSGQKANELCNLMMTNIMSGVQDLLKKEIAAISEHNERISRSFVSSNLELLQSNEGMFGSAKELFDNLGASNTILKDHGVVLRETDEKASEVLKSTHATLEQIENDNKRLDKTVVATAKTIEEHYVKSEKTDLEQVGEMAQSMKTQGEKCGEQLAHRILEQTSASVNELANVSKESFSFAKEELVDATASFLATSVEVPAASFEVASKEVIDQIDGKTASGREMIEKIAQSHAMKLDETSQFTEEQSNHLDSGFNSQAKSLLEHQEALSKHCDANEATMKENLIVCMEHTSSVKHSVSAFSVNVLKADEEPAPVEERNVLSFSEDLSSTPANHIILQALANDAIEASSDVDLENPVNEKENACVGSPNQEDTCLATSNAISSTPVLKEQTNTDRGSSSLEGPGELNKRRTLGAGGEPARNASRAKRVRTKR
jgi:hypothetical protein